jgi:predicted dehydrogenase
MGKDRVRWGILGAAKIAREWVAPAIHASTRGEVAAVGSRDLAKAAAMAAPFGARAIEG